MTVRGLGGRRVRKPRVAGRPDVTIGHGVAELPPWLSNFDGGEFDGRVRRSEEPTVRVVRQSQQHADAHHRKAADFWARRRERDDAPRQKGAARKRSAKCRRRAACCDFFELRVALPPPAGLRSSLQQMPCAPGQRAVRPGERDYKQPDDPVQASLPVGGRHPAAPGQPHVRIKTTPESES